MKPAPFEYRRPSSIEEVLTLLAALGHEAKLLAGGQSLIPAMNFRLARPRVVIDLNRVAGLDYIQPDNSLGLLIGAMTRQRALERSALVSRRAPLIYEAVPFVAHPQIRNRGTVGGSIAHADPAAELPAVMLALGARFELRSERGSRWVASEEFFTGLFATALEPDELLVQIAVPRLKDRAGCAFSELARRHGDYALVGVAAVVALDPEGRCEDARIALCSVGDVPTLARQAQAALRGERPTPEAIKEAAATAAREDIDPPGDIHASPGYRRHLAEVLVERTLTRAVDRARQQGAAEP